MKTMEISTIRLEADEGMILTNGQAYGREIYLGCNDVPENWHEITEEEYSQALNQQEKEAE